MDAGTTPTGDAEGQLENVAEADVSQPVKHVEDVNDSEDTVTQFLRALVECHVTEPAVSSFLSYFKTCSSTHNLLSPIDFPLEHPVEEVARLTLSFHSFS